jgi:hypothetical protein
MTPYYFADPADAEPEPQSVEWRGKRVTIRADHSRSDETGRDIARNQRDTERWLARQGVKPAWQNSDPPPKLRLRDIFEFVVIMAVALGPWVALGYSWATSDWRPFVAVLGLCVGFVGWRVVFRQRKGGA